MPKISTPRMPRSYASCATFTASSTDKWYCPGNVSISFFIPSPGTINNGYIKSVVSNVVSRTKSRISGEVRKRRGR